MSCGSPLTFTADTMTAAPAGFKPIRRQAAAHRLTTGRQGGSQFEGDRKKSPTSIAVGCNLNPAVTTGTRSDRDRPLADSVL